MDVVHSGVDHLTLSAPRRGRRRARALDRAALASMRRSCSGLGASDVRKNLAAFAARLRSRAALRADAASCYLPGRSRALGSGAGSRGSSAETGFTARAQILGYIDDALLVALYRHCLAYVFFRPKYEGFGLADLEASMACRRADVDELAIVCLGEVVRAMPLLTLAGAGPRAAGGRASRASCR